MKKAILKSAPGAVAAAASCFGAWKAYDAYQYEDNAMLIENLEALSDNTDAEGGNGGGDEMVYLRGNAIKKCWKRRWKETKPCDEPYHPKSCEVSIYAYDDGTKLVYEKAGRVKRSYAQKHGLPIWEDKMGACNYSTSATTSVNGVQPANSYFHSCQPLE